MKRKNVHAIDTPVSKFQRMRYFFKSTNSFCKLGRFIDAKDIPKKGCSFLKSLYMLPWQRLVFQSSLTFAGMDRSLIER
jgi:hypothetical protein